MLSGLATSPAMPMLVSHEADPEPMTSMSSSKSLTSPAGAIQDAKFKRREALADLAKAAAKF